MAIFLSQFSCHAFLVTEFIYYEYKFKTVTNYLPYIISSVCHTFDRAEENPMTALHSRYSKRQRRRAHQCVLLSYCAFCSCTLETNISQATEEHGKVKSCRDSSETETTCTTGTKQSCCSSPRRERSTINSHHGHGLRTATAIPRQSSSVPFC